MSLDLRPAPQVKVDIKGPSLKEKITFRWGWLSHAIAAYERFTKQHGNYFSSGITYSAVLALSPLIMVSLSISSLLLHNHQNLLIRVEDTISQWLTQATHSDQVSHIVDQIIQKRATVGLVGLLGMLYTGLNFISSVREALTYQWGGEEIKKNFFLTKLNDFISLIGLFILMALMGTLSFISKEDIWGKIGIFHKFAQLLGVEYVRAITILSRIFRFVLMCFMWTYVIARLPRIQIPLRNAYKAGLLMTILFSIFVNIVGILIAQIGRNPLLGLFVFVFALMLFLYWTFRLLLFCTSWAATAPENQKYQIAPQVPDPVIISPIIVNDEMPKPSTAACAGMAIGSGVLTALGLQRYSKNKSKRNRI